MKNESTLREEMRVAYNRIYDLAPSQSARELNTALDVLQSMFVKHVAQLQAQVDRLELQLRGIPGQALN